MNLTKKQLQKIIDHTPEKLKGLALGSTALAEELGTFQPCDANWSYHAGWLSTGELVVLRYGTVMFEKI